MGGLLDEGFEEVPPSDSAKPTDATQSGQGGNTGPVGANRPDLRVVQAETSRDGKTIYRNVGGMWKNVSRNGNEFYTLLIGNLKLLVFVNTQKDAKPGEKK